MAAARITQQAIGIGSNDHNVYALSGSSGAELWRFQTEREVYSKPALCGALLIVGSDDASVYGLHAANGSLAWRVSTGDYVAGSAACSRDASAAFIGSGDGNIYAYACVYGLASGTTQGTTTPWT